MPSRLSSPYLCFETGSLCGLGWPGAHYITGWPWTHGDPPSSASPVLGQRCASLYIVHRFGRQALSLTQNSSVRLDWLVSEPQGLPSLPPQHRYYKHTPHTMPGVLWLLGIELRSPHLQNKHLTKPSPQHQRGKIVGNI